jgi:predicted nucleic acid-binding protein
MLVVSDASPINTLIQIGQVDVLPALFGSVVVPLSVTEEMSHAKTPVLVRAWIGQPPSWLTVRGPAAPAALGRHRGEQDAIRLAAELRADAILLDEEKPRMQAAALGLTVVGTVGILERAADRGLIADLRAVHARLRQTTFRVTDQLLDSSLARHLSRKQGKP